MPGLQGDSLLEQINSLFEPPGRGRLSEAEEAETHPYFKRPGKGHNHDCCDSCGEGGALICCDSCPASFHFQCHDPPLEDLDIPEGDWICIKCFAAKPETKKLIEKLKLKPKSPVKAPARNAKSDERSSASPEKSASAVPPLKPDKEWRPGGKGKKMDVDKPLRATRTLKKKMYSDNTTEEEESEKEEDKTEPEVDLPRRTYKELYIEHLINKPTETSKPFSLLLKAINNENATEFELPKAINLSEVFPYSWKWSTDEKRRSVETECERGTHIMCYVCCKTSRAGPMVTCDFCPLSFHLDCLDPPMSEIPRDVWMCPNHVESFLDTRLTTSSVTERVNLWEKYARQPIDTNAVKLQFMKRCQREKRDDKFVRKKVPVSLRKKVAVPGYVKSYYSNPPPLLPGPDNERWHQPKRRRVEQGEREEAEMEWVSGLVSLQTDLLRSMVDRKEEIVEDKERQLKEVKKDEFECEVASTVDNTSADSEVKDEEVDEEDDSDLKCDETLDAKSEDDEDLPDPSLDLMSQSVSPASTLSTCSLSPRHRHQLSSLTPNTTLASITPSSDTSLASMLSEYLAQHRHDNIAAMDPVVVQYLAHRQLQTLMGRSHSDQGSDGGREVRVRASLTPLHSRRAPVHMRYRSLSIGLGSGSGLNLSQFGHCNFVSPKHATIFYDELSDCYELLNYSQHGTRVDEVLYSLDTAAMAARFPAKKLQGQDSSGDPAMASGESFEGGGCYCQDPRTAEPVTGCESSALLRHGSLIQIGCLQFVFSITEAGRPGALSVEL